MTDPNEKPRILIVDDDPRICELLSRFLGPEGYECATAVSGEEALSVLRTRRYDLVLTDVMMPGMSGVDLLNIIKRLYPDTDVLAVTAVDDVGTGKMALELGAVGYIIKPFTRNQILIDVARALGSRGKALEFGAERPEPAEKTRDLNVKIRKANIPASHIVDCVRSGLDDASLMKKFGLSATGVHGVLNRLVSEGKLKVSELEARTSLSAQTAVIDAADIKLEAKDEAKPVISAADAVACIRAGMSDLELMDRYGLSAKGLRSLFTKLVTAGFITTAECYRSSQLARDLFLKDEVQGLPKHYLAVTTRVFEPVYPEVVGMLCDITEKGIGIEGIPAKPGEIKTFVIPTGDLVEGSDIWLQAYCLWAETKWPEKRDLAGFQITKISQEDLETLRKLIRVLCLGR